MQTACETGDAFALLEGGPAGAGCEALGALYHAVREPWLVRALLLYHARTGSARALELLARAPEPHARHALDALADQLRAADPPARHHALAALAPLVARRPPWLHLLLPPSTLVRDLLRAARREREAAPRLNALLALAALLPAAPALAAAHAPELAEALTRAPAPQPQLALGTRALFLAAYATAPCSLLEALRAGAAGGEAWELRVETLVRGVQLHPGLVTGSRRLEADGARWARTEPHDVLAECGRLALPPPLPPPAASPPPCDPAPEPCRSDRTPPPGSGAQVARSAGALRPGGEGWFALGEKSGAEAAPHTPLPPEPEPAVEATPENTPAREPRHAFRFPAADSPAARALLRTPTPATPTPPAPDACAARLARVQAERRAQDSPVPFGGAPPPAAARPEPRHAAPAARDPDDTEVHELTARTLDAEVAWAEAEGAGLLARPLARPLPRPAPRRAGAPLAPLRASSCGPEGGRREVAAQTVDAWPEPYEFLVADLFAALPDRNSAQDKHTFASRASAASPVAALDRYLSDLYAGGAPEPPAARSDLAEQLALAHAQLMYERWRRDAHAERNRRLLGRCRTVRALELDNAALAQRVQELTRERDALRAARRSPPAGAGAGAGCAGGAACAQEEALESALAAERALRLRAEAAWRAAEAARARDAAELQRTRGETFEAARHVEALARAALAAERRAEHVRRLRRELLLLAEREARLASAVRSALEEPARPHEGVERALRAACARAEADAEAAAVRAEGAGARLLELEAGLLARDAALKELKRASRAAAEESAARAGALRDKYAALLRVVRASGARDLERRARVSAPRDAPLD